MNDKLKPLTTQEEKDIIFAHNEIVVRAIFENKLATSFSVANKDQTKQMNSMYCGQYNLKQKFKEFDSDDDMLVID